MKLKVIKCVDPRNPLEVKYRLAPFYSYNIDLDGIAENISRSSSVNKADVLGVIDALKHELCVHLINGGIVLFDGFGSFRLSISSMARNTPEETSLEDVRGSKIIYRPDGGLKEQVCKVKYEKMPYDAFAVEVDGGTKTDVEQLE
ncbi:MAG: hypothetical protein K2N58_05515 [Treponemataceae bacterium]|nr:hypothetical protein [Treponemataceae bacterium]